MRFKVKFTEDNPFNISFLENDEEFNSSFGSVTLIPTTSTSWESITNKPFSVIGDNLKVDNGVLSVDTAPNVERDNTKPITSAAVYTEIGNIDVLLSLI